VPIPSRGFELDLTDLEPVASTVLPDVAAALAPSATTILTYDSLEGPGHLAAVSSVEGAYESFTDLIGERLVLGGHRISATAQALRDVIALYRRADGQG
jgi:hypothetical protein